MIVWVEYISIAHKLFPMSFMEHSVFPFGGDGAAAARKSVDRKVTIAMRA